MVHIPKKLITITGGRMKPNTSIMLEVEICGRLILPTIIFHREDVEDHTETPVRIELSGVGARIISAPLDYYQDIMEQNPKNMKFEGIVGRQFSREFFTEISFMRSIKAIRCLMEDDDRLGGFEIIFKKSPLKCVATNLGTQDDMMARYVRSH